MTPARLREILEAYGADPARWPEAERDRALALAARSPHKEALDRAAQLDRQLQSWSEPESPKLDPDRVTAAVTTGPDRRMLGGLAADARRYAAGLAAAAVAGFVVGWSGLDRTVLPAGEQRAAAEVIAVAIVMEDATW